MKKIPKNLNQEQKKKRKKKKKPGDAVVIQR